MKGLIALDLDGTVLSGSSKLEFEVQTYLEKLFQEGYSLLFISGRTFKWMFERLSSLNVPYTIGAQNGAFLIEMPEKKILESLRLDENTLQEAEKISKEENLSFIVYGGYEEEDVCVWHPDEFSAELREYLVSRYQVTKEKWVEGVYFKKFAAIKWIGSYETLVRIAEKVEKRIGLHITPIKDPFNPSYYVAQATHPRASKGEILKFYRQKKQWKVPVIAAGDDMNDMTMLQNSDIKVVMETAPDALKEIADIIAPTNEKQGIMEGLKIAIAQFRPIPTVGVMIFSSSNRILLTRSWKWHNKWALPGGKIELGESMEEACIREVKEETNLVIKNLKSAFVMDCIFSSEFYKRRHFIMHDYIAEVALGFSEADVVLNEEADAFVWVTLEQAKKMDLIEPGFRFIKWIEDARNNRT